MAIPNQINYSAPVPPKENLPASRAAWIVDPSRVAVLVHDLQKYFVDVYSPEAEVLTRLLDSSAAVLDAARSVDIPIFYTGQSGLDPDRGLQNDLWGAGMLPQPQHTEIVSRVAPQYGDRLVEKKRYSAFSRTDFATQLSYLGRTQLIILGIYAHVGIAATALDAFQRDIQPFIVADGIADMSLELHRATLAQLANSCAVVTLSNDVVKSLSAHNDCSNTDESDCILSVLGHFFSADTVSLIANNPTTDLFEMGLSSLEAFRVLDELDECGFTIEYPQFLAEPTLAYLKASARQHCR